MNRLVSELVLLNPTATRRKRFEIFVGIAAPNICSGGLRKIPFAQDEIVNVRPFILEQMQDAQTDKIGYLFSVVVEGDSRLGILNAFL